MRTCVYPAHPSRRRRADDGLGVGSSPGRTSPGGLTGINGVGDGMGTPASPPATPCPVRGGGGGMLRLLAHQGAANSARFTRNALCSKGFGPSRPARGSRLDGWRVIPNTTNPCNSTALAGNIFHLRPPKPRAFATLRASCRSLGYRRSPTHRHSQQ